MNTFPLIRTKWSNERLMTILLLVTGLYDLPRFIADAGELWNALLLLVFALLLDTAANFFRFRKPVCAVSAAVTALILFTLSPGTPFWMELIALAAALLVGKHLWGGTGKNPLNPAMVGLLLSGLFFPVAFPVLEPSWLLLPAVLLSLPFLLFRPFAGLGMGLGMSVALLLHQNLTPASFIGCGIILWSAMIITDPVTMTAKPVEGTLIGLLAGFLPLMGGSSTVAAVAAGVLGANILSFVVDSANIKTGSRILLTIKHERIPFSIEKTSFHDLTEESPNRMTEAMGRPFGIPNRPPYDTLLHAGMPSQSVAASFHSGLSGLSREEILKRIECNEVFGFGGAAFPTGKKIRKAMDTAIDRKHLIVNGVECDPGLIHDKWLLRNKPLEIMKGIELLCRIIPFATVTVAVKDPEGINLHLYNDDGIYDTDDELEENSNAKDSADAADADGSASDDDTRPALPIRIHQVKDFYPAGAEKLLIRDVLGRKLPDGGIPAAEGILVLNVQTVYSIYEAVFSNQKADTRYVTLANLDTRSGSVLRIRLGANVHTITEKILPGFINIYTGGGIMNAGLSDDETVVDRQMNFLAVGKTESFREALCSRCGLCSAVCPARLNVQRIARLVDEGRMEQTLRFHPEKCLQCGGCSYVCLADRNLAARTGKSKDYSLEHSSDF